MERLRKLLTTQLAVQPLIWFLGLLTFSFGSGLGILSPQVHGQVQTQTQTEAQQVSQRLANPDHAAVLTQAMNLYWSGKDIFLSQRSLSSSSLVGSGNNNQEIQAWINQANLFFRDWFGQESNLFHNPEFIDSSFPYWSVQSSTQQDDQSPTNTHWSQEVQRHKFRFFQDLWDLGMMLIRPNTTITKRQALSQLFDLEQSWRLLAPNPQGVSIQVAVLPSMIALHQSEEARAFFQINSPLLYSEIQRMFSSFAMDWEQYSFQELMGNVTSAKVQRDFEDPLGIVLFQEANAALEQSTELELEQLDLQLRNLRRSQDEIHWYWLSLMQDRRAAQQFLVRGTSESDQFRTWLDQQVSGFLDIPLNQVQSQVRVDRWITNGSTWLPAIHSLEKAFGTYGWFFRQEDTPGALETLRVLSYWGMILNREVVDHLLKEIQNQLDDQLSEFSRLIDEFQIDHDPDHGDGFNLLSLSRQIIPMITLIEDPIEHVALIDRFLLGIRVLIRESFGIITSGPGYQRDQAMLRLSLRILDELFDSNISPVEAVHLLTLLTETDSLKDLIYILDSALVIAYNIHFATDLGGNNW